MSSIIDLGYQLLRPFLFGKDAEDAHSSAIKLGKKLSNSVIGELLDAMLKYEDPRLNIQVAGIDFRNPIGLAAGFDKNAELVDCMPYLGFGFQEIGTVTPRPQMGNERPRLFRLVEDNAAINRMGFNNDGLEVIQERLRKRQSKLPTGANVGKNKETIDSRMDYEKCAAALLAHVDYLVVNVSSPNTPGLRQLQDKEPLMEILEGVQSCNKENKPIFLKISPDLNKHQLDDIAYVAQSTQVAAVIATNTSITRDNLKSPDYLVKALGPGGLSGDPIRGMSTHLIRLLYQRIGSHIPIIGVGGIRTGKDAYEKIRAGASLVQVYTGMVYEGPGIVHNIKQGLVRCLERDGYSCLEQAVGKDANIITPIPSKAINI